MNLPGLAQPRKRTSGRYLFLLLSLFATPVFAATVVAPGDLALRSDIQLLADAGILRGPVSAWPIAWGPVLEDLRNTEDRALPPGIAFAVERVRARARREARRDEVHYHAYVAAADNPARLRSFADTPRESGEVGLGLSWIGDRLSIELNAQAVASPDDGEEFRADGSQLGLAIGNYTIAASTMERWWGPGWDGSLILSDNARPIPALTIDRNFTDAFESRWLAWLGPWDVSVMFGRMESDRAVPDARFFGLRLTVRPLQSLEIGVSRTAQWCGEGRPCGADTFLDLLLGRDNTGDSGIGADNEPGNQLAGFDARWSFTLLDSSFALYGQFIGEDEAGGFPSRYLAQAGFESFGTWRDAWSYRFFAELAGTSCDVVKEDIFDCAYNHSIYETGYRYRGRAVGHSADGDAMLFSTGLLLSGNENQSWWAIARAGELNRGGAPDDRHSLTPTPQDVLSLDVYHSRPFRFGVVKIGAGVEQVDDAASDRTTTDARLFLQWQTPL